MIRGRSDIACANRIVIKAGTSVVSTPDGYPSLSRIASIVENAARLAKEGKQILIVTSGLARITYRFILNNILFTVGLIFGLQDQLESASRDCRDRE
jgi:hypothetical protein